MVAQSPWQVDMNQRGSTSVPTFPDSSEELRDALSNPTLQEAIKFPRPTKHACQVALDAANDARHLIDEERATLGREAEGLDELP
jgi:hypothetical protein